MSYQTFVALAQLSSSQMNQLQQSVYTRPKTTVSSVTYTLSAADAGKIIEFTNAGSVVVTVPNSSSYDFAIGTTFYFLNAGTGTVTIGGASGVIVNAEGGLLSLPSQWSSAEFVKVATNTWVLSSSSSKVSTAELEDNSVTPAKLADVTLDTKTSANTTGSTYELVLTDKNKIIEMNFSGANTVTVPLNATQAFGVGTQISVVQYGLGKTQIIHPSGVTIIATPGAYLRARYSSATLVKRATNEWYLFGDLSAS